MTSRREFIKSLPAIAAVPSAVAVAGKVGQPRPSLTMMCQLGGITCITRYWDDGDEKRCRLCQECTAERGSCVLITDDKVTEEQAPLYDSRHLDCSGDPGFNPNRRR